MDEPFNCSNTNNNINVSQHSPANSEKSMNNLTMQMLYNTSILIEMAMELKEKSEKNEKIMYDLRNFTIKAHSTLNAIKKSTKSVFSSAHKSLSFTLQMIQNTPVIDDKLKYEYEKLMSIAEKEMAEMDDADSPGVKTRRSSLDLNISNISKKIRNLEEKQKNSDNCETGSTRSFKSDVDEKYPDKWMKESLLDLDNVINLSPVPEDTFASFTKSRRTRSLSSFKNFRKMQWYFQRAESTSDEESETDETNLSKTDFNENEDQYSTKNSFSPVKCAGLDEIKEEEIYDG